MGKEAAYEFPRKKWSESNPLVPKNPSSRCLRSSVGLGASRNRPTRRLEMLRLSFAIVLKAQRHKTGWKKQQPQAFHKTICVIMSSTEPLI